MPRLLSRVTCRSRALACVVAALGLPILSWGQAVLPDRPALEAKFNAFLNALPAPQRHFEGLSEPQEQERLQQEHNYPIVAREKAEGQWFAALLSLQPENSLSILARFQTWKGLMDFLEAQDALVEVWAYTDAGPTKARRLSAVELATLKKEGREQPTFITATYLDEATGQPLRTRVEFGFQAAEQAFQASQRYRQHRELQLAARQALSARDADGRLNAHSQWEAITQAVAAQRLALAESPAEPTNRHDLFVAFEYEVDELNTFARAVRVYRESEVQRSVVREGTNQYVQVLFLLPPGQTQQGKRKKKKKDEERQERQVRGYRVRPLTDTLEPVINPVPGQDAVELRVVNAAEPDARKWNVLEFGEPELLRQSALARFSLINAHLERQRKGLAIKKSTLDLIAEPIFAGLNIGGGLAAVSFPIGEAARLGYNSLITPWYIPRVPSVKQMRELFQLMAAREKHPELKTKPGPYLEEKDVQALREASKELTDAEVADYLQQMPEEDLKGMLRIAKMQRFDAHLVNLLSIIADAGKVSGWTDEPGWPRDVFNSIYFSVTGEISIKNIIAVLAGAKVATPESGVSLKQLSEGEGPGAAWWQYLNFTVDIRAVVNTVMRLTHRDLADKELKKPFPYAPRMSDLSAYELRIFGFPMFIFYKRGLLKKDDAAFQNDYAYGLLGATIVEHFPTRQDMDAEIRAGRMVPLGYVRVPTAQGWKETSLAVFAHRVPEGKHKGKTTMIIYGLKAYTENSALIEREYRRFKQLEKGLADGAVLEQVVDADNRAQLEPAELETTVHFGAEAEDSVYSPLLANLLEWRRASRRHAWRLPSSPEESNTLHQVTQELAARGLQPSLDEDPLLGVDRYHSSFVYRKKVDGHWRTIQLTHIPSLATIQRDQTKAEEGWQVEQLRRDAVASGQGVVLLNTVRELDGRHELGPLLRAPNGQLAGAGVRIGPAAVTDVLERVQELPVTERARLQQNHFAGTLVDLDGDGDGISEKLFLTIEFPQEAEVRSERNNLLSGEREIHVYQMGKLMEVITARRMVELEYDEAGGETRSRVFFNAGTREQPSKAELLEETRTLERWLPDENVTAVDPYRPLLSKVKVNYVSGQATRETYGLFPLPVMVADDRLITRNQFNALGLFVSAEVVDNGINEEQFRRPALEHLLAPVPGAARFTLTATASPTSYRELRAQGFKTVVQRTDVSKGLSRNVVYDAANFGRLVSESFVDEFARTLSFGVSSVSEYRDDFFYGLLPSKTTQRSSSTGTLLSEVETLRYDPLTRRLTGREVVHTGQTNIKVWDYRWENPTEIETALRKTVVEPNRTETSCVGTVTALGSGEALAVFSGQFDVPSKTYAIQRVGWFRPGLTNRITLETFSAFGKLMATRSGDSFEARPFYDADGIERTNRVYRRDPATGRFESVARIEDDYIWRQGARDTRVQTFLDGAPYDTFRTVTDSEGRLVVDCIKVFPGLNLQTQFVYDGASDRVLQAQAFQNGQVRVTHRPGQEQAQADGSRLLPVQIVPSWGLTATQTFLLGDPLGRPVSTSYENGDRVEVREWFPDTAIARVSVVLDRHNRAKEQLVKLTNAVAPEQGLPLEIISHSRIGFWGQRGEAETATFVRGTDIAFSKDSGDERIYYDLNQPLTVPWFSQDPHGLTGISVALRGARQTNVVRVFRSSLRASGTDSATNPAAPMLDLTIADLRGLFYHKLTTQSVDRAGKVLEEIIGRISNLGQTPYSEATIFSARATPIKRMRYRYEPGWCVERPEAQGGRALLFTTNAPAPGATAFPMNQGGWRERPTEIEGVQRSSENDAEVSEVNFRSIFRRSHSPRELERNPYMPDQTDVWTSWTSTEFKTYGQQLFNAESIYDSQGRLRVARATKTSQAGRPAIKVAYNLTTADPTVWRDHPSSGRRDRIVLSSGGQHNFSGTDFLYCYVGNVSNATLLVTDQTGNRVEVGYRPPDLKQHRVSWWLVDGAHVRWFPNALIPEQGAVVAAPMFLLRTDGTLVVSVHDLANAGVDVRRIQAFELYANRAGAGPLRVSSLFRLERGGPSAAEAEPGLFGYRVTDHSSGLHSLVAEPLYRTAYEVYGGHGLGAVVQFNGLPVANARPRASNVEYPHSILVDDSDTDAPRPLYSIAQDEGRFIEHYKLLKLGDAQVYTVVQGFALPRLEVYRGGHLADEITPGYIAYGDNYEIGIQYAHGRGVAGRFLAGLHNRVVANIFKFGGDRLLRFVTGGDTRLELYSHLDFGAMQNASTQAKDISELPTLAQTLLATREIPWPTGPPAAPAASTPDWRALGFTLGRLRSLYPTSGLVPTSLGTQVERYVDTVKEADVIILAAKLGELAMAGELLNFYWEKAQGGQVPLHSSYDAQGGTAMTTDPKYKRAVHSVPTAEAQLAMADAAFQLGVITGESQWLTLGRNLTALVLREFRPGVIIGGEPRGITEAPFLPERELYGVRLWPEAQIYSLRSNARAYLLLSQLDDIVGRYFSDPAWKLEINQALREQEGWLRQHILPQVERSGVVPSGVFEVQDIHSESTALAVDRWTAAEDWLFFLEAAQRLGVPVELRRRWLDNLARVHGVQVNNVWGLDWSLALTRPDAISTELTARFLRVARGLGYEQAERFAEQHLKRLEQAGQAGQFPAAATQASARTALRSGQGSTLHPQTNAPGWPLALSVPKELQQATGPSWDLSRVTRLETKPVDEVWPPQRADLTVFIGITAAFYLSILLSTLFWWRFRTLRQRQKPTGTSASQVVPEPVMARAEERWAKRVLGMQQPNGAEHTRFSNGPVEQNFLMQLRTLYKLVLEWRRRENGWTEDDPRLVLGESDPWLNGLDEFACLMGLYMRWVIKAGAKDGFARKDFLAENEDSNHIWSRLTMYFSEYHWALLPLLKPMDRAELAAAPEAEDAPFAAFPGLGGDPVEHHRAELNSQIMLLMHMMGLRQRTEPFDGRTLFDCPAQSSAFDLLTIQKPGVTLPSVMQEVSLKLGIPYEHIVRVVGAYKGFKRREQTDPIHPYLIEFGKVLPHFLVMGLGALVWYNQTTGDSPIVPYLWSVVTQLALSVSSLGWALPLFAALVLSVLSRVTRIYRHEASMLPRERTGFFLDATVTSLFTREQSVLPGMRQGRWWNPLWYERAGWVMRVLGFAWLGWTLLQLETPSFSTFLVIKGLLAILMFGEVAGIVLPLTGTLLSKWLQDRVTSRPNTWTLTRFLNRLNITATRPVSPTWLSIRYHVLPSMPSGSFWGMLQAIVFYLLFSAVFFFAGGFLCQQVLSLWFTETYLNGSDLKLLVGGLLFWNTMYLLRYGLFLMFTGVASLLVTFPFKTTFGLLAGAHLLLTLVGPALGLDNDLSRLTWPVVVAALGLMLAEERIVAWFQRLREKRARRPPPAAPSPSQSQSLSRENPRLGVVYMSGDELSYLKLTPSLLMSRWKILRDKLGSHSVELLNRMVDGPDDTTLEAWFQKLYEAEKRADVTLWHPLQLCLENETSMFRPELGLTVRVNTPVDREQCLAAWHVRRWLVVMMSTAGHSQDTGINLVDIAMRLESEGLAASTAFYLIQNKYDNNENNRPSQTPYDKGELNQRNKLCRLLEAVAPGLRAFNLQNWTPFGFKAGGLTGMDLVYEESLRLTTMLLLDRNATVHDLDALMLDLRRALYDPDIVIVIPGRSTTNTLTPLGQGSQMVEEGHRSYLRGLLSLLGGSVGESVGTGWGNLLASYYGRAQRAMVDLRTPKMPLTSRMQRGASFALKSEGLIGFTPHAVGISEDTWAVSQTTHSAAALGRRPKFVLSHALWHKIRETWSHSEWLASFPRWSGGFLQMMHDPLMQRINDFGPATVFAKEIRAQSGRNFLSAPFALFNILVMPLAIMLDVTPFVQILIVLWNFGFILNQILTVHGLSTQLESSGFCRLPALLGALTGTLLLLRPSWQPYAPAAVLLGFLLGGFLVGFSRWFYNRVRDTLLFGPQLVLHTLGQLVRQSLEFVVSGASPEDAKSVNMAFRVWAGPREDRPLDRYSHLINLKTVVWIVGVSSLVLNAIALASLGMLNVLLLLPSLLFSVSLMLGPFLMSPKVGTAIGKRVLIPQVLGWLTALGFYTCASLLVAQGGIATWFGALVLACAAALLLRQGLKYVFYRRRLQRGLRKLRDLLTQSGTPPVEATKLAQQLLPQTTSEPAKLSAELERAKIPAAAHAPILELAQRRLGPLLRQPVSAGLHAPFAQNRWISEFRRSCALASFVLAWFFIVPVPGLFVFTAGQYRFTLSLGTILGLVAVAVVLAVAGAWAGVFIQWVHRRGLGQRALGSKVEDAYRRFVAKGQTPRQLPPAEMAGHYAAFTDIQTYMDQRSYAYAQRLLTTVEQRLATRDS